MDCNKCGTPILPGEHTCRFCGTINDFSVRNKENNDHEIIDFTAGLDDVVVIDDEDNTSVIPNEIPNIDFTKEEKSIPSLSNEEKNDNKEEEIKPVSAITDVPFRMPAEIIKELDNDSKKEETRFPAIEKEVKIEGESNINIETPIEITPSPIMESDFTQKENKDVSMSEPIVITSGDNKSDAVEDMFKTSMISEEEIEDSNNSNNEQIKSRGLFNILTFILLILLIVSVVINCFLLMGKGKEKKDIEDKAIVSTTNSTVYFNNYKMEIPSNWITVENENSFLTILDSTEKWAASINVAIGADASLVSKNSTNITTAFGNNKYLFTSEYSKTVNHKDFYIFKGKYLDYSVYVMTVNLNGNTVVADLKFKGEVDENIVSSLLNSMTTLDSKDLALFFGENFEFTDVTSLIKDNTLPVVGGEYSEIENN